jgi:hypothetical protein
MDLFINICVGIVLIEIIVGTSFFAWFEFDKWYTNHSVYVKTYRTIRREKWDLKLDKEKTRLIWKVDNTDD